MNNQNTIGVPDQALPPGALSEEEYRKVVERLEEEYPPLPADEAPRYWDDLAWIGENAELWRRYQGKWVAIHNRRILAEGDDYRTVVTEAETVSGLPRHQIAVTVIPDDEAIFWDPHAFDTSFSN